MEGRVASGMMLTLLLIGMSTLTFNIQSVKAELVVITVDDDRVECPNADFTSIQEAVNAANPGDTICVYSGIYHENLVVNKTVSLIGQGPRLTYIIGDGTSPVVYVKTNNTVIRGFTIHGPTSTHPISGIYIYNSSGNDVSYNAIMNNQIGIYLHHSNNNIIHHNNFFTNTVQAYLNNSFSNMWDEGYPSGGNYWSDRTGIDLYSGPYQNETGSDGISDVPYTIDGDNEDRYPLMDLVNLFIDGWIEVPGWINIASNSTVSDLYFNPDEGAFIKFNVTGEEGTIGYCRATMPKEILWAENNQWTVLIDGEPVDPRITEDADNTYLYFTYNHSARTIQVIGTHVIPEFPPALILPVFMILTLIAIALAKRKMRNNRTMI